MIPRGKRRVAQRRTRWQAFLDFLPIQLKLFSSFFEIRAIVAFIQTENFPVTQTCRISAASRHNAFSKVAISFVRHCLAIPSDVTVGTSLYACN